MNGTGSCPGLGVRRSRVNPPHTCPGSHLSLLGSSRRVGGHRRRGGRAARGAERSERRGPRPPEGARPLPPAEAGTAASGDEGRRGRGPPMGCGAALAGGGPALGGSVPQSHRPTGAPRAQGAQLLPGPHSVRVSAHLLPPCPSSPLPSAPGALTCPFPMPRVDLGPPHCFRGSSPALRRFPGRVGDFCNLLPSPEPAPAVLLRGEQKG